MRGVLARSVDNSDHADYIETNITHKELKEKCKFDESGNPTTGHLWILFMSDEPTGAPVLGYEYRFGYKDI